MEKTEKRIGRPPNASAFTELVHVRFTPSMVEWLDRISEDRMDVPSQAALIREAVVALIEQYRAKK